MEEKLADMEELEKGIRTLLAYFSITMSYFLGFNVSYIFFFGQLFITQDLSDIPEE